MEQQSKVITLKQRPWHVRFGRSYANYRSLGLGIVASAGAALRIASTNQKSPQ